MIKSETTKEIQMKAIICTKYGPPDVLQLKEVEKPFPKDNEVRIKIHATSVTASDIIVRAFKLPRWHPIGLMMGLALGFTKPRNPILGMVVAGEVESAGKNVKRFKKGDQVYGWTIQSGVQLRMKFGAYAEYICIHENSAITLKPTNLTYEETAAIPYGGILALHYVKKGNIQKGQKVLIYGASGAIGTISVQLARHFGAEVTGICSTANLEMVKSLGADTVIDYTKKDFTKRGESYDFILDSVPYGRVNRKELKLQCKKALAPNGKYISVDDGSPNVHSDSLILLKELAEEGHIKPVIDRSYPLEQVAEAHHYVDKGHKKGNVVVTVNHNNNNHL